MKNLENMKKVGMNLAKYMIHRLSLENTGRVLNIAHVKDFMCATCAVHAKYILSHHDFDFKILPLELPHHWILS